MQAEITTTNMEEATAVEAARRSGVIDRTIKVTVVKKPESIIFISRYNGNQKVT